MRRFQDGQIDGVQIRELVLHSDDRGWLCELFRVDEIESRQLPSMGYASVTRVLVTRGPHEHVEQTDRLCFFGPARFFLVLWDNRPGSVTYGVRMRCFVGYDNPCAVVVPPGVVHAYRNVGDVDGLVVNFPNRLYRGEGCRGAVDEIRHELDSHSVFDVDGV